MKTFFASLFHWIKIEENFSLWEYFQKTTIITIIIVSFPQFLYNLQYYYAIKAVGGGAGCASEFCSYYAFMTSFTTFIVIFATILAFYNFIRYFILSFKHSDNIFQKIFILIFSLFPFYILYQIIYSIIVKFSEYQ